MSAIKHAVGNISTNWDNWEGFTIDISFELGLKRMSMNCQAKVIAVRMESANSGDMEICP